MASRSFEVDEMLFEAACDLCGHDAALTLTDGTVATVRVLAVSRGDAWWDAAVGRHYRYPDAVAVATGGRLTMVDVADIASLTPATVGTMAAHEAKEAV